MPHMPINHVNRKSMGRSNCVPFFKFQGPNLRDKNWTYKDEMYNLPFYYPSNGIFPNWTLIFTSILNSKVFILFCFIRCYRNIGDLIFQTNTMKLPNTKNIYFFHQILVSLCHIFFRVVSELNYLLIAWIQLERNIFFIYLANEPSFSLYLGSIW